eukprot:385685_1
MTTFGNPYDNQYHASSVQSGKSKRAASQNQKEARKQKKSKAKGQKVDKGTKGNYKGGGGKRGGKKGGRGGGGGGGGGFWGGGGGSDRSSDRGGSGSGGGGGAGADIGGGYVGILQVICCIAAIGQLVVGIIHTVNLFESLENICDEDNVILDVDCVGESLFWNVENAVGEQVCNTATISFSPITGEAIGGSYVIWDSTTCNEDSAGYSSWLNSPWRAGVFSLVPDVFADNWTPLIFGLMAIFQCIGGMQSDWISGSLLKCLIFHIIMMLFACFGYAGQAGIVIGFIEAFAGLLILIGMLMRMDGYAYPTFYTGCC